MNHVIPELLRIQTVGPGFLVLRNPRQFVAFFKVVGGLDPWMEDGEILSEKVMKLNAALGDLRRDEQIQVISKRVSADIEADLEGFKERIHENAPGIFKNEYPRFLENALRRFYLDHRICRFDSYVLFTVLPSNNPKDDKEGSIGPLRRAKSWASQLSALGMEFQECLEEEIYTLLYEEFCMGKFHGNPALFKRGFSISGGEYGFQTLREMLAVTPWDFTDPHFFKVGDTLGKTLYVTEFPSFTEQSLFFQELYQQTVDFKVSLFVKGVDLFRAQAVVEKQIQADQGALWKRKNVVNFEAQTNLDYRQQVLSMVSEKKTSLAKFSLYVTLLTETKESLVTAYEALARKFKNVHPLAGYAEQKRLFLSTTPQATDYAAHEHLQATAVIANALPVLFEPIAETSGVPIGKTISNQMVHLDLWGKEVENWNLLVVGSSGTGKSFTINQLLIRNRHLNPYVMVIDKSKSYRTLCLLSGGKYLNYDLDSKCHLNIFDYPLNEIRELDGEIDPDHISSVIMFLGVILANVRDNSIEEAEELDKALLQEAIKATYRNVVKENRVPLLSDLKETLSRMSEDKKAPAQFQYICRKQAEILKLYTGKGIYANLTDRESTVVGDDNFTVFDTSGISDNDKKAIGLAVFTISNFVLKKARENMALNRLTQSVLDEAWHLAQFPTGLAFLLRIAKTSRHLRLQPIFATQELGELAGVKGVEAILKNTATKILLKLVGDDLTHAKNLLQLNPNQMQMVSGLHQVKGVYSQAMIHQTHRQGVVNVYPDELSYHIATTYGPEAAVRDRYLEKYAKDLEPEKVLTALCKWIDDKENNRVLKAI